MQILKLHTFCFHFVGARYWIYCILVILDLQGLKFEISSYGNPMSPLYNPTSLIKIGFSNKELCPISHDDLIVDSFSRENCTMYHMSLFWPSALKIIPNKLQSILFLSFFLKLEFDSQRECYDYFPKVSHLRWNLGTYKNPKFLRSYLQKYSEPRSKFFTKSSSGFRILVIQLLASEPL